MALAMISADIVFADKGVAVYAPRPRIRSRRGRNTKRVVLWLFEVSLSS